MRSAPSSYGAASCPGESGVLVQEALSGLEQQFPGDLDERFALRDGDAGARTALDEYGVAIGAVDGRTAAGAAQRDQWLRDGLRGDRRTVNRDRVVGVV